MIGTDGGAVYRVFSRWHGFAERDVYELQKALPGRHVHHLRNTPGASCTHARQKAQLAFCEEVAPCNGG